MFFGLPRILGQPNSMTTVDNRVELKTSHLTFSTLTNSPYLEFDDKEKLFSYIYNYNSMFSNSTYFGGNFDIVN